MADCVLALDAGGTTTDCWVVGADGTVLGAGRGGPGNHILGSLDVVRVSFAEAIDGALATAGAERSSIAGAVAGCAGIEATGETRGPIEQLLEEFVTDACAHIAAYGDMVSAFHGALPGGVGVVVNAGTGAVAYGENAAGQAVQVDGWGDLFGDDGSAYAIGRAALRAAAKSLDGRGPETTLITRMPAALGVESMPAAAYAVYGAEAQRTMVAGLAVAVAATAGDGDAVAQEILHDAGAALAATAAACLRRLDLTTREDARVATAGSVFNAGGLVEQAFAQGLRDAHGAARIVPAVLPPAGGAAKLAWRGLGQTWDDTAVARARQTQPD